MSTANETNQAAIGGAWRLDRRRSSVEFRARHFWGLASVTGSFDDYHGELDLSATPAIELTIDANSVQTGNRKRDEHLRSADFFDVGNHPLIQFLSDSVEPHGDVLNVRGHLSARGRGVPLELIAQVRQVDGELEIQATTTAPHRELGLTWNPLAMIRPRSELSIKARLIPNPARAA